MRNRFKGLDLTNRLLEEQCVEVHNITQKAGINIIPNKKKFKRQSDFLSSEIALQIAVKRREMQGKGAEERHTNLNAKFQRIERTDKKAFLSIQPKEIEEKSRM